MKFFPPLRSFASGIFRRSRMESEMDTELRSHIEAYGEDLARGGLPREEAMRRARMEFGGIERAKEECREARGVTFLQSLAQDIRYGLRMLRKSPGFTAVAVLTLALGIGANTAIFSVVYGVVLKPLPYRQPARLVRVYSEFPSFPNGAGSRFAISPAEYLDLKQDSQSWQTLDAWVDGTVGVAGKMEPIRVYASFVTGSLIDTLGVSPVLGRTISPSDDLPGAR